MHDRPAQTGVESALADIIAQAPEDAEGIAPEKRDANEEDSSAVCRCLPWRRPRAALKVTAVVPEGPSGKPVPSQDRTEELEQVALAAVPIPAPEAAAKQNQFVQLQGVAQLGPQFSPNIGRKTLVLDLDETLVHSSFRAIPNADLIIQVPLPGGETHPVYVRKRPGVDEFLSRMGQLYEVVVYTASLPGYANPLLNELDKYHCVAWRLFRESCTRYGNYFVKDLSKLGRPLASVIIIDNSPNCYALQPDNAIPIKTWRQDPTDSELLELIPILYSLVAVPDIPTTLRQVIWSLPDDAVEQDEKIQQDQDQEITLEE